MIVVVIMSVVVAMVVPRMEPGTTRQLSAAGGIVVADLDYARHLAVMNASSYEVAFDADGQSYTITHSGTNADLDTLPASAFRRPGDPADEHIGRFADFPQAGIELSFRGIRPVGGPLTFGSYGELAGGADKTLWLRAFDGQNNYYLPIHINAVTGLATLGQMQIDDPIADAEPEAGDSSPSLPL